MVSDPAHHASSAHAKCPTEKHARRRGENAKVGSGDADSDSRTSREGRLRALGLLAEAVDADLADVAFETRGRITLAAEVVIRSADVVRARRGRDRLALVEGRQIDADGLVRRLARDVAAVV